jgi:hypothetical protein
MLLGAVVVALVAPACASATSPPWVWREAGSMDSRGQIELACPSASVCLALDSAGHVLASRTPAAGAHGWTRTEVTGAPAFRSLACASASECFAADATGDLWAFSEPADGVASPTRQDFGPGEGVTGVACPSAQICVGVAGQDVLISTDPEDDSWEAFQNVANGQDLQCLKYMTSPDCSVGLTSVACSSSAHCLALDGEGGALDIDPETSSFSGDEGEDPDLVVNGPACIAGGPCLIECAVGEGEEGQECPGTGYGATDVCDTLANCYTLSSDELGWFACPIESVCFTSDVNGRLLASTNPTGGRSTWKTVIAGANSQTAYRPVQSITCPSRAMCVAVEQNGRLLLGAPPPSAAALRVQLARALRRRHGSSYSISSPSTGSAGIIWSSGRRVVGRGYHTFDGSDTAAVHVSLTRTGRALLAARPRTRLTETIVLSGPARRPLRAAGTFVL